METESEPHFTYAQLRAGGLDDVAIRLRLREGTMTRIRRGVYCITEDLDPLAAHRRLIRATVPMVDPRSVLSHHSAGVLHGLPVPRDQLGIVSMTRRTSGHARSGTTLRVHTSPLADDELTLLHGHRVTTLARTTFDLTRTLPHPEAVAVADAALRIGLDRTDLMAAVDRRVGLHGRAVARMAAGFADPRAESPAESLSRVQFARYGIPAPVVQFRVVNVDGEVVARTDFGWPQFRLVGEIDGKWKYGELLRPGQSPEDAIMNEKRREEQIRELGYWIVRWDWALALQGPELAKRVRRAIELQRRHVGV